MDRVRQASSAAPALAPVAAPAELAPRGRDAPPELAARLATAEGEAEGESEELAAAAGALDERPAAIARVAREDELAAVLAAPIQGSVAAAYQRKEAAIRAELDRLSAAECRALAERLRRARPGDSLASLFGRMTAERRGRLLAYLDDARRREALRAARAPRGAPPSLASSATARSVTAPSAATSSAAAPAMDRSAAMPSATGVGGALRAMSDSVLGAQRVVLEAPRPSSKAASASRAEAAPASRSEATLAPERRPSAEPDVAWAYVRANRGPIVAAIGHRLAALAPPAHERLAWIPGGVAAAFVGALEAALGGDQLFARLEELVHPTDPWYVIDQHRELVEGTPGRVVDGRAPKGSLSWDPFVGAALAIEVAARVRESLARMAPRYAAQLDEKHPAPVAVADLVTSHPMDRVTARLLCDERVVRPVARGSGAAPNPHAPGQPGAPALFQGGLRALENWRWLGDVDARLWSWIEVKRPRDATAEDVAATLLSSGGEPASHLACTITAAPPFFRFDPPWARKLLGAAAPPPAGIDRPHRDDALALADSALATEAAIAQAADERKGDRRGVPLPPDLDRLTAQLERSARQLERAKALLAPWSAWEPLLPAIHWVASHREHLLAIPDHRLALLAPVIEGQQQILFEAVGAVQEVAAAGARGAAADGEDGPIAGVLRRYAVAIGESHLVGAARAQLAAAHEARAGLTLALMERSLRESRGAVGELQASAAGSWPLEGLAAASRHADYHRELVELRGRQAAGAAIDPGEVELLAANLKAHTLEAKVKALALQLRELGRAAGEGLGRVLDAQATSEGLDDAAIGPRFAAMAAELDAQLLPAWAARRKAGPGAPGGARDRGAEARAVSGAAEWAQAELDAFVRRHDLQRTIESALRSIEYRRQATAVVSAIAQIALLVGVSVVGNFAGGVVAGAVRGALLADAALAAAGTLRAARVAQVVGAAAGLAADAAVNTAAQVLTTGHGGVGSWLENFVSSGAVLVALRPLHAAAAAWGAATPSAEAMSLWARTGRGATLALRAGAVLGAEMITGAAVSYLIHRAQGQPPDEKTAMAWALEGASMAIGKLVAQRLQGLEHRLVALAEHGVHLRARAARARRIAEQIDRTGDKDQAMEVLAEHARLLAEEAALLERAGALVGARLSPETLATLRAGNRAERAAIEDRAFATMPLRLAGLEPDDASGKVWIGATEDIAIALHQASRSGLRVQVLAREACNPAGGDAGARQWRVLYGDEPLTIIERPLHGQPRLARPHAFDAERAHARRYAEAAEYMQEQWEARTKADLDARAVIEIDHLQIGHSIAGVVNQATLPASGEGLGQRLVVYDHRGTLTGRAGQELGQAPSKWDAAGVRGSEQAAPGARWITSEEHRRSLDIGRLEVQTPAYRGSAVKLERRPSDPAAGGAEPWLAPGRAFRVLVRDAEGKARWFYADRVDNAGGMGPGDLQHVRRVVEPAQLDEMLAKGQLLRGEDPDYAAKVRSGEIFVWGGTPTGAWGAEHAAKTPGTKATIMGDTAPTAPSWPRLLEEYEAVAREVAAHGSGEVPAELARRKQQIEAQIEEAHRGMKLRRNRMPGAAYEHGLRPGVDASVRIAFGTPSRIAPAPDGRVLVTVGTGADARSTLYDQVVIAHGQDPGVPGAPGALLGPGAEAAGERGPSGDKRYGEVPEGTIALRPIFGPRRDGAEPDLLGLESIDPPGLRLVGAAYATKKLTPWVAERERAAFERAIDRMKAEGAPTRDHGPISDDSTEVTAGIELQRDRIPRANEVLAARAYRLPGPEQTLELDPASSARWDDQVREWFAIHLRANGRWVKVQRLGGGYSRALVYCVSVDDNDVGVFKLFDAKDGAANEQAMLQRLEQAKLKKLTAVRERGRVSTDARTGYGGGALLMDTAKGTSIKELIEHLPSDPAQRNMEMKKLTAAMKRAAEGLAEMHAKFETTSASGAPVMMSREAKLKDANYFLDKSFRDGEDVSKVKAALGEADFRRVKAQLEGPMLRAFLDVEVPASAYHGDANAGNFIVDDYHNKLGYKDLAVIDVGSMAWSVDKQTGKGIKTGAADVARLLGSLETLCPGQLTFAELHTLRQDFMTTYSKQYRGEAHHELDLVKYQQAAKWYRIELEVTVLKSDARAKARIMEILGLEASP